MFYLLPMLAECGKGSISLQSPVTYQVEMDQCKRRIESILPDLPLFLLTLSRYYNTSHSSLVLQQFCLLSVLLTAMRR